MHIRCSHLTEAWGPDPGCREFMDAPELIQCSELAVGVVVLKDHAFGHLTGEAETTVQPLCPFHLEREFRNAEGLPPWLTEEYISVPAR